MKLEESFIKELRMILNKNKEYKIISNVSSILNEQKATTNKIPDDILQ